MIGSLFTVSDFVLGLLLIIGGLNLALPHGNFRLATFIPGVGLAFLGVFAFALRTKAKESRLFLPRVLVYGALFLVLTGAFIQNWFQQNGAVRNGDWCVVVIGGIFLLSNAVGYAVWGGPKLTAKRPD